VNPSRRLAILFLSFGAAAAAPVAMTAPVPGAIASRSIDLGATSAVDSNASISGGYLGQRAPFHAIPYGDNWFYQGSFGYNPAVGVGTMDVADFAAALQGLE
jgi:hypothetical protein